MSGPIDSITLALQEPSVIPAALALILLLTAAIVAARIVIPRFIRRRLNTRHLAVPFIPVRDAWRLLTLTPTRERALPVKQIVLDNFPLTPLEFFAVIEHVLDQRNILGVEISLIMRREGGLLSPRRRYLHISYQTSVCILTAVPLGTALAITWRIGELSSWATIVLREHPQLESLIDWFLRPPTFYRTDINNAFRELTRQLILAAVDRITDLRGFRPLTAAERQGILGG